MFNLTKKLFDKTETLTNQIIVEFDASRITQNSLNILYELSSIIQDTNDTGKFELDIFSITINNLDEQQSKLIDINSEWYRNKLV
jgi:hypothetical protein